jgi:hypothetical protein
MLCRNLGSHIKGRPQTEGVLEHGVEKIFGPLMDEATGDWRKQYIEEHRDMHSSPDIAGIIKSRRN